MIKHATLESIGDEACEYLSKAKWNNLTRLYVGTFTLSKILMRLEMLVASTLVNLHFII